MLQVVAEDLGDASLNREGWHQPLVSIIITHYNYSSHIRGALLSLLDQTHQNWECVVVDDASAPEHREHLRETVDAIGCSKIRIVALPENVGQIPAFFVGMDATSGHFVCLLDPDDRYAKEFIAEAVAAHLNNTVVCPLVCTDQYTLVDGGITSATHTRLKLKQRSGETDAFSIDAEDAQLFYFPIEARGWFWTSTSSLMFRRAALKYMRPHRALAYKRKADSYLAFGAHILGGTIFLGKPLVYRSLHEHNSYITNEFFSSFQDKKRDGAEQLTALCRADVLEALQHNKAPLRARAVQKVHGGGGLAARMTRSLRKRWRRIAKA
jgi:glycosyltransferase involved in cell wall biosynthesis